MHKAKSGTMKETEEESGLSSVVKWYGSAIKDAKKNADNEPTQKSYDGGHE